MIFIRQHEAGVRLEKQSSVPGSQASLITVQKHNFLTLDFGESGSYLTEKTFDGVPFDVPRLLCLNSLRFTAFTDGQIRVL